MTDPTEQITIGPLTAEEWISFFYIDGHPLEERNPLPPCCADISEVRSAIAKALRRGGDPEVCWLSIALAWPIVQSHLELPIDDDEVPAALRKIYHAYVEGRDVSGYDETEAKARIMRRDPDLVRQVMSFIPEHYDLDTMEGRMRAVARAGGAFIAYVYDPAVRSALIRELATVVGMPYENVAMMVDVLRLSEGLPWAPADGARVP